MKARITITAEYELDPELHPEGFTYEEMVGSDIKQIEEGDFAVFDMDDGYTIKGEVLKEESK